MIMRNNPAQYQRDMKNNPAMRHHMAGLASDFTSGSIKLSIKPNQLYDLSDSLIFQMLELLKNDKLIQLILIDRNSYI